MPDTVIAEKPSATVTPLRTTPAAALPAVPQGDMLANPALFEHMQRVAKVFTSSALIPDHLKKNNGADAFLALQIARDRGESPVAVMQNIYFVSGKAGWMTAYMIGRANKSGAFKGRIKWRTTGAGDAMVVEAYAIAADDGEECSAKVSMAMAKAEGWVKNPKYNTMPEHMLKWRAATMLIRLYCPEVMHGMATVDELDDMRAAGQLRDVTGEGSATTADQVGAILGAPQPAPAAEPEPAAEPPAADGEVLPPAKPELEDALMPEGAGQEEITARIVELIKKAETVERVNAIVAANKQRTKTWTQGNRAKITIAADDRLEDLQMGIEQ